MSTPEFIIAGLVATTAVTGWVGLALLAVRNADKRVAIETAEALNETQAATIARLTGEVERANKRAVDAKLETVSVLERITALRDNCFVTNERGHRVRFRKASPARQAKAEGRA